MPESVDKWGSLRAGLKARLYLSTGHSGPPLCVGDQVVVLVHMRKHWYWCLRWKDSGPWSVTAGSGFEGVGVDQEAEGDGGMMSQSLYCGFHGKEQVRPGEQV